MTLGGARTPNGLQEVLRRYLGRNPDAADSREGIRRWWLSEPLRSVTDGMLLEALEGLVAAGEMQVHDLPDGTELYSRASNRSSAAERGDRN
jgi:hypothetical protein